MSEEFTSIDNLNIENQSITDLSLTNISPDQIYSEPLLIEDLLSDDTTLDPIPMCSPNISNITPFYKKGIDGLTLYVWIKFADTPASGMSDISTGKDYLGIAVNKPSPTESLVYSDYEWIKLSSPSGGSVTPVYEMIISTDTEAELTDENYLSSLRVLAEILKNNEDLKEVFLSKIDPDTAQGLITFLGGLTSTTADIEDLKADKGDIKSLTSATAIIDNITLHKGMSSEIFFPGFLGEGMELFKDEDGNWNFTLDNLTVRKQMNVFELVINRIKHVGGAFLFSPAGGTFISVEEHDTFWRCYVEDKNNNEFEIYDQVICQTFTKNRLKRYWRLAVNIGEDFVDLSKTDCESGSAYPEIDDEAVVLGNRVNNARQNAVLISSYGNDGSYQQFLNDVDTYSLADKIDIHFGKESFMRVNRLEIKGTDGKSERVPRDRGIFQPGETYEFYDRVVYNGRYWLCLAINTTSAPSDGEWQEQTNVRAGGKNLLREYDLRFDGKYWQGGYDSQFIDLSMLSDYLFNGDNDAIVTEGNIYIEL